MTVTIGAGVPISAHAADKIDQALSVDDQKKTKIRKEEERTLKLKDKTYNKQAKSLAKQYQETAKIVAKQGGDPKPLLDAAAYFQSQSK
jgi:hypothetical protein